MCEFKHTHMMRLGRVKTSVQCGEKNPKRSGIQWTRRPGRDAYAVRRPLTSSLSTSRLGSCNPSCRRACSCTRAGTRGCCKRRHPCPRCGSCGSDTPCDGGRCGVRAMSASDARREVGSPRGADCSFRGDKIARGGFAGDAPEVLLDLLLGGRLPDGGADHLLVIVVEDAVHHERLTRSAGGL